MLSEERCFLLHVELGTLFKWETYSCGEILNSRRPRSRTGQVLISLKAIKDTQCRTPYSMNVASSPSQLEGRQRRHAGRPFEGLSKSIITHLTAFCCQYLCGVSLQKGDTSRITYAYLLSRKSVARLLSVTLYQCSLRRFRIWHQERISSLSSESLCLKVMSCEASQRESLH